MQKYFAFIKGHKVLTAIVLVVILGGGFWYAKTHTATAKAQYLTSGAQTTTITVSVSATGQVSAENQIDLKPGSAGAITAVNVKAGDTVKAGQVLAVVDQSNNYVSLSQAKASVMQAQANYDKVAAGLTGSDLTTAQLSVTSAQEALDKAKTDFNTTVADQQQNVARAYTKLLNSGLSAVPNNSLSSATASLTGTYTGSTEGTYTITVYETTGQGTYYSVSGLGNESGPLNRGFNLPIGNGLFINFSTTGTINEFATNWTVDVPNKISPEYYTNLNAYNDALTNQSKAISDAQDAIKSAQENLDNANTTFSEKTAPASDADLASAKASLLSAQAQLQSAANNYNNNNLKSPFNGIVAALNSKVGDQVTASTVVATVITKQQLAVVTLNEVDAAKVQVGQKATLTFDALPDVTLTGSVVEVASLGTTTQGVVNYPVKIGLDTQNDQVKPSMSVSAEIITDVKTDVLAVPNAAVKTNGSGKYVQELDASGQPQDKPVETGISNSTLTEITSGITSGEMVVTQTIAPKTSSTSTTRTTTGIPGLGGGTGGGAAAGGNRTFIRGGQ